MDLDNASELLSRAKQAKTVQLIVVQTVQEDDEELDVVCCTYLRLFIPMTWNSNGYRVE